MRGLRQTGLAALVVLVIILAVGGAARSATTDLPGLDRATQEALLDGPDPCGPIMAMFYGPPPAGNQFAQAGLRDDRAPAALLDGWAIGSLYCFADGIEDRVLAVMVPLVDSEGQVAAMWLLLHRDETDIEYWRSHLRDTAQGDEWTPADYVVDGSSVTALRHAHDRARWTSAGLAPTVSMWEAMTDAVAEFRRGAGPGDD